MELLEEEKRAIARYRGFIFIKQWNGGWLVRPERSPMYVLPFRTTFCTLLDVQKIVDAKITNSDEYIHAA